MPTEVVKTTDRCELHPGNPTVARCDTCDRALCLVCATPVRGQVFGPECLPFDVADEAPAPPRRPPMPRRWLALGIALTVVVAATFLPWTRFGQASGWFGAWGWPLRWSMLAAVAGSAALAVWLVRRRRPGRGVALVLEVLGAAACLGTVLAIVNPPPFTKAALAPWIVLAAGFVAVALAFDGARGVVATRSAR
jgi:peptidoglycan/LPS O-acetylase OafA/YrhL